MKIKATSLSFYSSLANARGSSSAYNLPFRKPLIGSNSRIKWDNMPATYRASFDIPDYTAQAYIYAAYHPLC